MREPRCFGLERIVEIVSRCRSLDDCVVVMENLSAKMRAKSFLGSLASGLRHVCPDLSEEVRSRFGDAIDVFDECEAIRGLANAALMLSYRSGSLCVEEQGVMRWYFRVGCATIDVEGLVTALRSIAESRCSKRIRKIVERVFREVVGD